MQELLQGLQVLTARIAALERESMAKGKESRTVLRRSTLRVVVLKERQTVRATGGPSNEFGKKRSSTSTEPPGWKLQMNIESGVAEETMSATVKLAKEIDEPDKLRIEGESVDANEKNSDGNKGPDEVFDEGEDTDERVKTPYTEMCEKSKVTSVEEGHDVERVIVSQSDETADILKQSIGHTSADLTALEKKGFDRKTNHQNLTKVETIPRATRPPPWRDKHATTEYSRKSKGRCDRGESMVWLAPSYMKYKATIQEGVRNFIRHLNSLERVGIVQNTIPDELARYGFLQEIETTCHEA